MPIFLIAMRKTSIFHGQKKYPLLGGSIDVVCRAVVHNLSFNKLTKIKH